MKRLAGISMLIAMLLTCGCNPAVTASTSTPLPASLTIAPSSTATLSPTANQLPTETQTFGPTITPTVTIPPTIVWMPLPTLTAEKAEMKVLDLLNHNAGCHLPCWWGITPGETSEINAIQFLSTFTDVETVWGLPGDYHFLHVEPGSVVDDIDSNYKIYGGYGGIEYTFQNGLVDTISAYHGGGTGDHKVQTFQLSRLLADYGKPDEAAIWASPGAPGGSSLDLYIIYDIGIFVDYLYFDVEIVGNTMRACPQGIGPEELNLWSPKISQSTLDYYNDYYGIGNLPILQTAIGMDLNTFYNLYKGPDNRACIETPVDLWMYK